MKKMSHKLYSRVVSAALAFVIAVSGLSTVVPILFNGVANAATYTVNAGGSIQTAIDNATDGDTINVAAGTYTENIVINKDVTIAGAGQGTTSIVATNANATPVTFATNGATVSGFTITHAYTDAEKTAWNFNNNDVTFNQGTSGNTLTNDTISLGRNGVYLNNASATITNSTITNNRTGFNLTNKINGTTITNNTISNNWTLGLVYYEQGFGTNFNTVTLTGNTFTNNWYTQVEVKTAPLSTGTFNVAGNTYTNTPITLSTSSDPSLNEPGFAAQQPVALGGTAVKPTTAYPTLRIYGSDGVTMQYDTTAPVVSIVSPANNAYVTGNVTIITNDVETSASVNFIMVTNDTTHASQILLNDNTGIQSPTVQWDTTGLSEGTYTIYYEAKDLAGNDTATSNVVTVDHTFPHPSLNLTDGQVLSGTVAVTGTDVEAHPSVNYITVTNDMTHATQTLLNDNTAIQNPTVQWNTKAVADGNYTVYYEVKDLAGNDSNTSVDVTVDNTAPIVTGITYKAADRGVGPLLGTSVFGGTATFTVSQTEAHPNKTYVEYDWLNPATHTYQKKTGEWFYGTNTSTLDVNTATAGWVDGTYQIKVSTWDTLNNQSGYSQSFVIDNTAPTVVINDLSDGQFVNGQLTITGTITDPHPSVSYLTVTNNTTHQIVAVQNVNTALVNPSVLWDATVAASGTYTIRLEAKDLAGNDSSTSLDVVVDHVAPTAEVAYSNTDPTNQPVTVKLTTSEPVNPIDGWNEVDGSNGTQFTKVFTENTDGTVTVNFTDLAGNPGSAQVTINNIDTTAPTVSITSPENNVALGHVNSVNVTGNIGDSSTYVLTIDGIVIPNADITNSEGSISYTWDTSAITSDANHTITLSGTDSVGNPSELASVTFELDNAAPVLTINPSTGTDTTPTLTGTTDNATDVVTVDGNEATVATTANEDGTYNWAIILPTQNTGTNTVSVVSTDTFGNATQETATVTVIAIAPLTNPTDTTTNTPVQTVTITPNNDNAGVLGDQTTTPSDNSGQSSVDTTNSDNSSDQGVKGATDTKNQATIFGLAWYWWLLILAVLAVIIWRIIAAYRARQNQQ